ncbi:MAG: hypothetical protein A3H42_03750 [Deltaproteobacteria bacterium RIFCSPLOWO2_02_FULL_46_8]|nr:MAG: hypothetical protein A3H42_03750 [Deltaproteobacteria bacterium RIFCSPLOWO2_02_FULL_46_8]
MSSTPICQPFIIVTHNPEYAFRVVDKNCDGALKAEDGDDVFVAGEDDFLNLVPKVPERVWNHLSVAGVLKPLEEYAVERDHRITIWKMLAFGVIMLMGRFILEGSSMQVFLYSTGTTRRSSNVPDWT